MTQAQVRELFSIFGTIVDLEMPMDSLTGRHKGFSFVEMATVEQAARAILETNGKSVWGRTLKVNRPGEPNVQPSQSQPGPGMSFYGGQAQQQQQHAQGGPSPLVSEAMAALQQRMQTGGAPSGGIYLPPPISAGGPLPSSSGGGGGGSGAPGSRIYVGNLAYDITGEHIRSVFSAFGPINEVSLQLDRENNNRPRGYCFVQFENPQHAADAIASMHGFELCGRKLRVNAATAQGTGHSGQGASFTQPAGVNAQAVMHAQATATLLQSAGVGVGGGLGAGSGSLESDGFLSGATQRAALMEKLARSSGNAAAFGIAPVPQQLESPVLLLRNLVGPGEVDAELESEVRDEAGQFGSISKVVIHETQQYVLIFVLYPGVAEAARARQSLDKRIFAGKLIRALPYPLAKFQAGVYTPEP